MVDVAGKCAASTILVKLDRAPAADRWIERPWSMSAQMLPALSERPSRIEPTVDSEGRGPKLL